MGEMFFFGVKFFETELLNTFCFECIERNGCKGMDGNSFSPMIFSSKQCDSLKVLKVCVAQMQIFFFFPSVPFDSLVRIMRLLREILQQLRLPFLYNTRMLESGCSEFRIVSTFSFSVNLILRRFLDDFSKRIYDIIS